MAIVEQEIPSSILNPLLNPQSSIFSIQSSCAVDRPGHPGAGAAAASLALARALSARRRRERVSQPGAHAAARPSLRRAETDAAAALHRLPGGLYLAVRLACAAAAPDSGDHQRADGCTDLCAHAPAVRRQPDRLRRRAAGRRELHASRQRDRAADRDAVSVWIDDLVLVVAEGRGADDGRRTTNDGRRTTDDERRVATLSPVAHRVR